MASGKKWLIIVRTDKDMLQTHRENRRHYPFDIILYRHALDRVMIVPGIEAPVSLSEESVIDIRMELIFFFYRKL